MTTAPSHREPEWVVLLAGLFMIAVGSQAIVIAMVAWWGLGLAAGVVLLLIAWRFSPSPGAQILRRIITVLGMVAVLGGLYALGIGGIH